MNMISHNFKNVLKNKLESVITDCISNIVDDISLIFSNTSSNKYLSTISSFHNHQRELIKKTIEETLNYIDLSYKNSLERKKFFKINKSNVERTITTIFGEITFKRTYYQSLVDSSYHFLLDEELGLIKYDKYDPIVKGLAIDNSFQTNPKKAGEIVGKQLSPISSLIDNDSIKNIPRQSIYNWINNWNIPNFEFPDRNTPNVLYIMVDEKYLGCQDLPNDIMVKSFVSFEGVKQISKGRRKLLNRLVYSTYSPKAWPDYVDWLYQIYDSEQIETIYILSDGGKWIKSGINELKANPNMVLKRLLCEYHFVQSINRMTTDKDFRDLLKLSFKTDTKKEFTRLSEELLLITPEKEDKILTNLNYITNNYKNIKDMINFEIGSSMESHISHCIASFFSSRPKGFSSKKINQYLKINDYKNNNINLYNLYLKSYDKKEEITLNTTKLNFAIFEPAKTSNIPIINKSNIDNKIKYKLNNIKKANAII